MVFENTFYKVTELLTKCEVSSHYKRKDISLIWLHPLITYLSCHNNLLNYIVYAVVGVKDSVFSTIMSRSILAKYHVNAAWFTSTSMTLGSKSGGKPSRKHTPSLARHVQLTSRVAKAYMSSGKGTISGSSSSRHIHHSFSKTTGNRITSLQETLTATEIQTRNTSDYKEYQERLDSMTTAERSSIKNINFGGFQADDNDPTQPAVDIMDILSGQDSMEISHVGGEFADLLALGDDLLGPSRYFILFYLIVTKTHCNCKPASCSWWSNTSKSNTTSYGCLFAPAAFTG